MPPERRRRTAAAVAAVLIAAPTHVLAHEDEWDNMEHYGRTDPHTEGGERLGDDPTFTGYPADPGDAGDLYYDATAERRAYSPGWTGAFVGIGALGGVAQVRGDLIDRPAWGPATGALLQLNSLNQIIDIHASWRWSRVPVRILDTDTTLTRNALDFSLGVHPFFIWIIGGDLISYIMANSALNVGPSVDFNDAALPGRDLDGRAVGWHIGPSFGFPVDNTQDGNSVWVELAWTYKNSPADRDDPRFARQHLREHWLNLRVSWRHNGNVGFGAQGPDDP